MFRLTLLGGALIEGAAGLLTGRVAQRRQMALLAYLACRHTRSISRDKVMALLWPEADDTRARRLLSDTIYQVRRELGDAALASAGMDLRLGAGVISSDVGDFEVALAAGSLEHAVSLYRGPLLDGFHVDGSVEFEQWVDGERDRLARAYAQAIEQLAGERESAADHAAAAVWWRRLGAHDPSSGRIALRVMRALDAAGDRSGAITHARAHALQLREQFGLEPDAALAEFADALRSDSIPRAPATALSSLPGAPVMAPESPRTVQTTPRTSGSSVRLQSRAVAAVTLVLAAAALGAGWRLARPVSRDLVLVADVAGDTAIGDFVAERLRQVLAHSASLEVMPRPAIAATLQRMGRRADARVAPEIAREIAVREGLKAFVRVDVLASGDAHYFAATLVSAETSELLASEGAIAANGSEVVTATDRLVQAVAARFPKTVASITRRDRLQPLTTDSLSALLKHWEGFLAHRLYGDVVRAIELDEEAIAIDPNFAQAHAHLHAYLVAQGNNDRRATRALLNAYRLRHRLTAYERNAIEAQYLVRLKGDFVRAVDRYRAHVAEAQKFGPNQVITNYLWLAHTYVLLGQLDQAEHVLRESRTWFRGPFNQSVLVRVLYSRNRDAEARAVLADALEEFPQNPWPRTVEAHWTAVNGDPSRAHELALRLDAAGELPFALRTAALFDAVQGRVTEAITHLHELRELLIERDMVGAAFSAGAAAAQLRLMAGDTVAALNDMDELTQRFSRDSLAAWEQPALLAARLYARAGRASRASELVSAYERAIPSDMPTMNSWLVHQVRAEVALANGDARAALVHLRPRHAYIPRWDWFEDPLMPASDRPEIARAWLRAGSADSAIAVYERYVGKRSLFRSEIDAFELADAYAALAALHDARGDAVIAAQYRRRLATLWRAADPGLKERTGTFRAKLPGATTGVRSLTSLTAVPRRDSAAH